MLKLIWETDAKLMEAVDNWLSSALVRVLRLASEADITAETLASAVERALKLLSLAEILSVI